MTFFIEILVFSAIACSANSSPLLNQVDRDWEQFKLHHNKSYSTPFEERIRKQIYLERKEQISKHNEDYKKGLHSYQMDLNHLSDMHPHEIHGSLRSILGEQNTRESRSVLQYGTVSHEVLPENVDWRLKGAVTPVKDQQECAACYAFATTGALEAQIFLKTGKLESLSEQNLVDCTYRLGTTGGCEGGNVPSAMKYAMVFGVDSEESYPYKATTGRCRRNVTAVGPKTKIPDFHQIQPATETALMQAVATTGPIAACFQTSPNFDSYKTGVFYQEDCTSYIETGHCALVVGYGTTSEGQDYWLVKNSMGPEHYGEQGYIRMARNKDNMCGIASHAYYPLI